MKRSLLILLVLFALDLQAQTTPPTVCPDYSAEVTVAWARDPLTYRGAVRGPMQIVGNNVVTDSGDNIRGAMAFVLPIGSGNAQYIWPHWMSDSTYEEMASARHYNAIRATFYQKGDFVSAANEPYNILDTNNAKLYGRQLVDKATAHGFYVFLEYRCGFGYGDPNRNNDTTYMMKWWQAMGNEFKDDKNVGFILMDEPHSRPKDYTSKTIAANVSLEHRLHALNPDAIVVAFEVAGCTITAGDRTPKQLAQMATGMNWTRTAFGWHAYPTLQGSNIWPYWNELKASYPQMMTAYSADAQFGPNMCGALHPKCWVDSLENHGADWFDLKMFPWYQPHVAITGSSYEVASHSYHVATTGSNSYSGESLDSAWRDIAVANATLRAGDTVTVHGGTYYESIKPTYSGTLAKPIIYRGASPDQRPVLNPSSGRSVQLASKSYIHVLDMGLPRGFEINGGSHNYFYNDSCALTDAGKVGVYAIGKLTGGTSYNIIRRCFFNRRDSSFSLYGGGAGVQIAYGYGGNHHNLIDSCMAIRSSDADYVICGWDSASYNVFRADTSRWGHTGFLIEEYGSHNMLDHCVVQQLGPNSAQYQQPDSTARGRAFEILGQDHLIVRYCIAIDDTSLAGPHDATWARDLMNIAPKDEGGSNVRNATNYYIYHNTFWNRHKDATVTDLYPIRIENNYAARTISNIQLKNNIVAREHNAIRLCFESYPYNTRASITNYFTNNLFWRKTAGDVAGIYGDGSYTGYSLAAIEAAYPLRWSGNLTAYPKFVDTTSFGIWLNLRPDTSSPAIDASAPETYTSGAGSGTLLTVTDASWFWAGNEILPGDSIRFGRSGSIRRITAMNGNTLTLNAAATWTAGDSVYLWDYRHWSGQCPDIGAIEYTIPIAVGDTLPSGTFTVSPSIIAEETSCRLQWTSQNATSLSISPGGFLDMLPNDFVDVTVSATTTYTLTLTNSYGSRQYQVTVTLRGTTSENIIRNGRFEEAGSWNYYSSGTGNNYTRTSTSPYEGSWSGLVNLGSDVGTNNQLYQHSITLEPGALYRVSFVAKASAATSMYVNLYQHVFPNANYGIYLHEITLGTGWSGYTFDFTSTNETTVNDARLQFQFNGITAANRQIWFDTVSITRTVPPEEVFDTPTPSAFLNPYARHLNGFDWLMEFSLVWPTNVPAEAQYVIYEYSTSPTFTSVDVRDSLWRVSALNWTGSSAYETYPLQYGVLYYLRFMCRNGNTVSPWSGPITFWTGGRAYFAPVRKLKLVRP